jgi:REP element-mobilizing transposase RayT
MMSTHQQLLYHIVFSTKRRKRSLRAGFRDRVFAYMAGVAKELDGFPVKFGGYDDHVHLLVRIPAKTAVSSFVGQLKACTSKHINSSGASMKKFGWQDGFGAFTVSASQQERVAGYIAAQLEHHQRESFQDEYLKLLLKHNVEYDPRYVWD